MFAVLLDPVDEVVRHRREQRRLADDQRDLRRVAREEQRALPGRVGAAEHEDVLTAVDRRLGQRRAVVDAGADERREPGHVQLAHRHARRQQQRVTHDFLAVRQLHDLVRIGAPDADGRMAHQQLGAEALGLRRRAPGEVGAGDAVGKPEIVLDHRARAGLAAGRVLLDQQRPSALRTRRRPRTPARPGRRR